MSAMAISCPPGSTLAKQIVFSDSKGSFTFNSLTGTIHLSLGSSTNVDTELKFSGSLNRFPKEMENAFANQNLGFNLDGVHIYASKTSLEGVVRGAKFNLPLKTTEGFLTSKLPDSIPIKGGDKIPDDFFPGIWNLRTRDGGSVEVLKNWTEIRITGDDAVFVKSAPVLKLRMNCRYNHCVWFKCHVRTQNWDIDAWIPFNADLKLKFFAGGNLADTACEITSKVEENGILILPYHLHGMNDVNKTIILAGTILQRILPIDEKVAELMTRTTRVELFKTVKDKESLERFQFSSFGFRRPANDNLVVELNEAHFNF